MSIRVHEIHQQELRANSLSPKLLLVPLRCLIYAVTGSCALSKAIIIVRLTPWLALKDTDINITANQPPELNFRRRQPNED